MSPALGSPDFGNWERERSPDRFAFRLLSYNYDLSGAFGGTTEVTGNIALADGGKMLSYTATVKFFDAWGGALFSVCGAATGTRF